LPPPVVVSNDHGSQRFLLFTLPAQRLPGPCTTPAMAWFNTPAVGAKVAPHFEVSGWAFKDGVGIERVEVLLDGKVAAQARYGETYDVTAFWKISTDPGHPRVGFRATLDASALAPGTHWLGLRLHGRDGSVEDWWEQPIDLRRR
jgi:hypothetical protein